MYDPVATETGRVALNQAGISMDAVTFCETPYEVAQNADALVIVTEWNEFKSLNMHQVRSSMRRPVLIDGRNMYEATDMERYGFIYRGMGRGTVPAPSILPPEDTAASFTVAQPLACV